MTRLTLVAIMILRKKLNFKYSNVITSKKLDILSNTNFIIEYLTILFHEIFHAIQYQYMNNFNNYLISTIKNYPFI